ncbi:MAG TPA: hypothetical protein VEY11_15465 [Pyrinomonadaceae bacterium]|nr:hypothetical protein [Pyrinomonadaceae bacterium]
MDRVALRDAVYKLEELADAPEEASFAFAQAVCQFNSLLDSAKLLYSERPDIQGLYSFSSPYVVRIGDFKDGVSRLKHALDLRPINSAGETLARIQLPSDAPADVVLDMQELEGAISLGLTKTALLLSGSIAEALLLTRHSDKSAKGPGLAQLVKQARDERLFGRDTLRGLETLVDYRDLIHPRAPVRNKTPRNSARVDAAVAALKLLCHELQDPTAQYN